MMQKVLKRLFDICLTGVLIIILLPLFCVLALVMKTTMPGPLFFKQERIGLNGVPFQILKLRTMRTDQIAIAEYDSSKDGIRITGFGRLLRRFKIDELPQIINVFIGQMSIVGPRPTVRRAYDEDLTTTEAIQNGKKRVMVRPGITGWAQIHGNTCLTWNERVFYDAWYVDHFSIKLDLMIIFKTVLVVLFGEDKFVKRMKCDEL